MNNMQQILARAQKLQAKVTEAQKRLEHEEVSGTSGNGSVEIVMNVKGTVKSVTIKKEVIDPDDKDLLEDLVLAAFNDAKSKADTLYDSKMKEATGGFDIPGF